MVIVRKWREEEEEEEQQKEQRNFDLFLLL